MSKKSQNGQKKLITKIISWICILGLAFGIGLSQVGVDELNEQGISIVFKKSMEVLEEMMSESGSLSVDSSTHSNNSRTSNSTYSSADSSNGSNSSSINTSGKVASTVVRKHEGIEGINPGLNIYSFYVGQADCTLIECGGEYLLIDAGNNPDGKLIVSHLKSMGIKNIKYFVVTHTHEDHAGGGDDVINNIKVKTLYIPDVPKENCDTATYKGVKQAASDNGLKLTEPKVGHKFKLGDATCEVMAIESDNKDMNHTSIVIEMTYGNHKFLFMGDAEIYNEEQRLWNDVDVLKLGHHGSSTSTGEDFLAQTMPEIGLISCGVDNEYGHPHDEVMDAMNEYNVEIYRTDIEGTIHLVSDGIKIGVETLSDIILDGNK